MELLNPLNISPFFTVTDNSARKKEKEKTGIRAKKEFDAVLRTRTAAESVPEENAVFTPEAASTKLDTVLFDEKLTELIDAVYACGDALKKRPFTDTFLAYKQSLSRFMRFVVDNSYEVEVRERRKGKKRRISVTVQIINAKLDELATGILYNQIDQLKILAKVEQINGILIDFMS